MRYNAIGTMLLAAILLVAISVPSRQIDAATAFNTFDVSEEESTAAAATLNQGLSEFHLMLAALETSSLRDAETHKVQALEKLDRAIAEFGAVVDLESEQNRPLRRTPAYVTLVNSMSGMGDDLPVQFARANPAREESGLPVRQPSVYVMLYESVKGRIPVSESQIPQTRGELAQLAVQMTQSFRDALVDLPTKSARDIHVQIGIVISSSLRLLELGLHATAVWHAQRQ